MIFFFFFFFHPPLLIHKFLLDYYLEEEYQEPGEGGVLPPSHQVAPLQFEVSFVPSLHHHQPGVGGGFSGYILITCEG